MKKISSVILCLILCLNIVGCSSNPAANTSSQISSQENEESNTARSLHFSLEKQGVDINIWREDEKLYVKNNGDFDLDIEIDLYANNEDYSTENYSDEIILINTIPSHNYKEVFSESNGNKVSAYTNRVLKTNTGNVIFTPEQYYFDGVVFKVENEDYGIFYQAKNDGYYVVKYEDRDNYKVADDWDTYFLSNVYEDVKLVNKDAQNSEIKVFTWEQNVKETKEITGVDLE